MKQHLLALRRAGAAFFLTLSLCISAFAAEPDYLVPGGETAGIRLSTEGLLVTKLDDGSPAKKAGLRVCDTILSIDGQRVFTAKDACGHLSPGKGVRVCVRRGEKTAEFFITPEKTSTGYRLGVSVRDNISGIGTITFYDPETGVCGALGHGVAGLTGTQPVKTTGGVFVSSRVTDVKKGVRGTPGELHGSFDVTNVLGSIRQNETHGIFGTLKASPDREAVKVADASDVHTGPAVILANVEGTQVQEYCVRIDKIYENAQTGRDLLVTVTDERLLSITGGIVQGMSGSPILQNGKLVGALTHVLVNRPAQGYGIFISNMLSQCDTYK